jgi:hypothetical protein
MIFQAKANDFLKSKGIDSRYFRSNCNLQLEELLQEFAQEQELDSIDLKRCIEQMLEDGKTEQEIIQHIYLKF